MKNQRNKSKNKRVYLDYAASTPIDKRVALAMQKAEQTAWANPSSLHTEGEEAKKLHEEARIHIARLLQCRGSEIFFTSGGTEGCNIGVLGVIHAAKKKIELPHVIVSSIEHPAVLEPIKRLLSRGEIEVSFINPDKEGIVSPLTIEKEIKKNTVLVALMHANNEIGTIQPIQKVAHILKSFRLKNTSVYPYLFVDASQSVLFEEVTLDRLGADLLVLDGIKMYGPRGAGILVLRHAVDITPVTTGGGQERGMRPGTENVLGAVGFAEALKIAVGMRKKESERFTNLRDYAIHRILQEIPGSSLNGSNKYRVPNNINICFASPKLNAKAGLSNFDSEFLVIKLDTMGFAVSAASACQSISMENSSYVIEALGKKECAGSSLRFTLGRSTKKGDIDKLITALKKLLNH